MTTLPLTLTQILFTTAWRSLSHQAVPAMFNKEDLDENGLIPRYLCPDVYDEVVRAFFPSHSSPPLPSSS